MCGRRSRHPPASHPTPRLSTTSPSSSTIPSTTTTTTTTTTSFPPAAPPSSSSSSSWSASSLASLRNSLPDKPTIFPFPDIASATNNFLANRISSSSSSWRCPLRARDSLVFQRPFRADPNSLPARLASLSKSHHRSVVPLLGASLSADRIYLVYHFVPGASLSDCLHNPKNPHYTPLSTWMSRAQIASEIARGLEYIHHHSAAGGIVHNRVKSSAVVVTEPNFNAVICHFGAAFLAGDLPEEETTNSRSPLLNRSDSDARKIEGTRGYLAPEVIGGGGVSRRSDVFAFGVLLLELMSGDVPVKFRFDEARREYRRSSVVETAKEVMGEEGIGGVEEGRRMRVRQWVDRRLRDSFPVEVVEKMMGIALRCVDAEPERRPSMIWVQGKISKLFLKSKDWAERVSVPADFSVSLGPR